MTTILVVEDEKAISRIIVDNLIFEGYEVLAAADGPTGLELALSDRADLILLDIMLPGGLNGYDICRQMREQGLTTPVIMLTARSEEVDKITGFELLFGLWMQLLWVVFFILLCRVLLNRGLARYSGYGG